MTTQHASTPTPVRLGDPGDLIAAIPHLLGFHPVDSLVVMGLHPGETARLGVTLRADLPPPEHARLLARQLLMPLQERNLTAAAIVVIGPDDADPAGPPRRDLPQACVDVFADAGILVEHQLWAPSTSDGARWCCYDCDGCGGKVPDPNATPMAAASVAAGVRTYNRRDEIVESLAPVAGGALARRANLLEAISMAEPDRGDTPGRGAQRLACVRAAVRSFADGATELTDEKVVELADALSDHRVRDACLDLGITEVEAPTAGAPPADPDQVSRDAAPVERLWTALVRATPGPERAESACLLAFAAHVRGDGVLAGIALERAEDADPGHRLTALLRDSLLVGIAPERLWTAGVEAAAHARRQLEEDQ